MSVFTNRIIIIRSLLKSICALYCRVVCFGGNARQSCVFIDTESCGLIKHTMNSCQINAISKLKLIYPCILKLRGSIFIEFIKLYHSTAVSCVPENSTQ